MKLERFKEKDNKRIGIVVFTIFCIGLIMGGFFYRSFAIFEEKKNFNVIEGTITNPGDLYFAYYLDNEISFDFPAKDSGYIFASQSNCNNGVTVSFDKDTWKVLVNYENYQKENSSKTKCNLYFESIKEYIEDDGTIDHNSRYVGSNPNNYVKFNNELWRIIGVMNNIDDGTGKKETRMKLIRNDPIGEFSWDTSASSVNNGNGINEWSEADLMKLLNPGFDTNQDLDSDNNTITVNNSLYWNKGSGTCYNMASNATTSCDFTSIGLTDEAKELIGEAVWNLGANDGTTLTTNFYETERGKNKGKTCTSNEECNDNVERTTSWTGYVGLMYPSDYGFATSGGGTTPRTTCLNNDLENWTNFDDCRRNNWLLPTNERSRAIRFSLALTMSPMLDTSASYNIWAVPLTGKILKVASAGSPYFTNIISPVVYLKSNVILASGSGTSTNPYELALE